jgi:hypothetical protein
MGRNSKMGKFGASITHPYIGKPKEEKKKKKKEILKSVEVEKNSDSKLEIESNKEESTNE